MSNHELRTPAKRPGRRLIKPKKRRLEASLILGSPLLSLQSFDLLSSLQFTSVFSDTGDEPEIVDAAGSDGSSKIQLDQFNAKIRALETQIDEKTREVKGKDELVAEKEKLGPKKLRKN
ncbi:BnaC04g29660D [Brassica napus]|uniref:(rape) hypothetical protein n=1 Tax=Brassica napus TaxID=3708 RepID=A0A078H509_BRANA|nr:unnamed protein product [Brassica napus]CDY33685.1 BnaC04g29660D [Brassica napus]